MAAFAWFMSTSPRVRYSIGVIACFAQGIPMGLLHIALPAWLASGGDSRKPKLEHHFDRATVPL